MGILGEKAVDKMGTTFKGNNKFRLDKKIRENESI